MPLYQVTLPTGLCLVHIAPEPGSFGLTSWNAGSLTCEGAAAIDVKPGSTFHDVIARDSTLTKGGIEKEVTEATVSSSVTSASFASCKDFRSFEPAGSAMIDNAAYQVTLPAGTYRALIQPGSGQGSAASCPAQHQAVVRGRRRDNGSRDFLFARRLNLAPFTADLKSLGVTEVSGTADSPKGSILNGDIQFYASCDGYQDGNPIASAPIDNGTYSAEVPAGTYRVRIVPFDTSGALKSWHDKAANCATSSAVTINPDPSQTLALHALAGVVLTGSVTSNNGSVTSGSIDFYKTCSGRGYFTSIDNGSYTVAVPGGNYRAFISADTGTGAVNSWHSNAQSCADAQVVDAAANGTRNLVAKAGFAVSGTVSSSKGSIADGSVTFFRTCDDANSGDSVGSSSLNAGAYNINLPNGTYRAFIEPDRSRGALGSWNNAAMSCERGCHRHGQRPDDGESHGGRRFQRHRIRLQRFRPTQRWQRVVLRGLRSRRGGRSRGPRRLRPELLADRAERHLPRVDHPLQRAAGGRLMAQRQAFVRPGDSGDGLRRRHDQPRGHAAPRSAAT